jgi:integrase/recombinase XerD
VHHESGAAALLPRLLAGRTHPDTPVFLTNRKASTRTRRLDVCPATGRVRPSCRRGAELFERAAAQLHRDGGGWTLHQLRHSLRTHEAETGTSTTMLLAISRPASVRSLERYARP